MPRLSPRLWAIRSAFRTVGVVAPALAARWAETLFPALAAALVEAGFRVGAWAGSRLESTSGLGHRALLRDPAAIGWSVEFLWEGSAG